MDRLLKIQIASIYCDWIEGSKCLTWNKGGEWCFVWVSSELLKGKCAVAAVRGETGREMERDLVAVSKLCSVVSFPLQNMALQRWGGSSAYMVLKLSFINLNEEGWTMFSKANRQCELVLLTQLSHLIWVSWWLERNSVVDCFRASCSLKQCVMPFGYRLVNTYLPPTP